MMIKKIWVMSVAALLLSMLLPVRAAENDTVQAIIPWEASGRVFQADTSTMLFLGAFTGVMYIESSQGEMHEAFVMCPIRQKVNLKTVPATRSATVRFRLRLKMLRMRN